MRTRRVTPLLIFAIVASLLLHILTAFGDVLWDWWNSEDPQLNTLLKATTRKLHSQAFDRADGSNSQAASAKSVDTLTVNLAQPTTHPVHTTHQEGPAAPPLAFPPKPVGTPRSKHRKSTPPPSAAPTAAVANAKPAATPVAPPAPPAPTPAPAAASPQAQTKPPGNTATAADNARPVLDAPFPRKTVINYLGNSFLGVEEHWTVEGNHYDLDVNLSMFGHWRSTGEIGRFGIKPLRYTETKPKEQDPHQLAEFDWTNKVLRVGEPGKLNECPLKDGAVDILSAGYQFAMLGDKLPSFDIQVASGKKCYDVHFAIIGEMTLTLSGMQVDTIVLGGTQDDRRYEYYLAPQWNNLPVRMHYVNGTKSYDLVATRVIIDDKTVLERRHHRDVDR